MVANQLHELDRTLSQYLEQLHSGFIQLDGKDRNCPTLLHFAAKQQMTQVVTQLLKLPDLGGLQMSSILNQDGLSPRDLAVQAGNLELAKLLKNPDTAHRNLLPHIATRNLLSHIASHALDINKESWA